MNTQYRCKNEARRLAVGATKDGQGNPITPKLNGIDYLEVEADQLKLKLFFLHNPPGESNSVPPSPPAPALTASNFAIEGGVRVKNIQVQPLPISAGKLLTLTVNAPGDYSTYTLRIVTSPTQPAPPPGFDPQLSAVEFSFKVECPSEFDCETVKECPPPRPIEPEIDYLAKDYASFRRLMLDRLSVMMPEWRERNPADLQVALVEMLAYAGDHLSYYQDAVATEAYLGTARQRVSVRRHARLLDYHMHDGCNARTWVRVEVKPGGGAEGQELPAGTALLTRGDDDQRVIPTADSEKALADEPTVFETMHDLRLHSAHNRIPFYTWSDSECCLPRGATRATLRNNPALSLQAGDVLIFEEVSSPTTGLIADADPKHRHAVRLIEAIPDEDLLDGTQVLNIEWHAADALPFPLCLTALVNDTSGTPQLTEISVARGNVALADHGLTIVGQPLVPALAPNQGRYRPQLARTGISFAVPYDHELAQQRAASEAIHQDPRQALPAGSGRHRQSPMSLGDGDEDWLAQRELLGSDRFAADFVVEMERDGSAHLRFGDGTLGKEPLAGSSFTATYRIGNGRAGNVGAESLKRIISDLTDIVLVTNSLPGGGGADAETIEEARQFAPQAFRTQERAVTESDYAEVAERHPQVQKAAARFRWTGSWHTVFVTIDRRGGLPVRSDENFRREIRAHLERYRLAGYDLEITDPLFVPLEVALLVCVKPGYFNSNVKAGLLQVFSNVNLPNGGRGFFHPDNFTFGQPVYLSRIFQTAMSVAGVASVEVKTFQRYGRLADGEREAGVLQPAALEIIQLDNDPNFPENGKLVFDVQGGL